MGAATDNVTTEIEWQFAALDVRPVLRWLTGQTVPGYDVRPSGTKSLRDTYYDTSDWRVHRSGYTLRVRERGGRAEATMKSMAEAVDGVRTRIERTEPIAGAAPADLRTLPGEVGEALRSIAGRQPLEPLFLLETERTVLDLFDGDGPIGEVALDTTTIPIGVEDHPVRLSRVEVEVTSIERAKPFVDVMVAAAVLQPAATSKFQAALVATGQSVPAATSDFGPTDLDRFQSAAEYGLAILRRQFAVLLANEPGTRLGENPEYLHDVRVASRRIRAALAAFDPWLPLVVRRLRSEVAWLTRSLGAVRDLDVQLEQLTGWRDTLPASSLAALDQLEAALLARRALERKRMLRVLDSARHDRLVQRFAGAVRRAPPKASPASRVPVVEVAPVLVRKRYRRVRRLGDPITPASPAAEYHALRIEAKKLRYACEFAAPLYGRAAATFASRVTALQDVLGRHQDADVAVAHLLEMSRAGGRRFGAESQVAIGMLVERYNVEAASLRRKFPAVYSPLRGRAWRDLQREFRRASASAIAAR